MLIKYNKQIKVEIHCLICTVYCVQQTQLMSTYIKTRALNICDKLFNKITIKMVATLVWMNCFLGIAEVTPFKQMLMDYLSKRELCLVLKTTNPLNLLLLSLPFVLEKLKLRVFMFCVVLYPPQLAHFNPIKWNLTVDCCKKKKIQEKMHKKCN